MEPLFLEMDESHATFISDFYKMVVKKLVPKRSLLQISEEAEHLEAWRLDPVGIQKDMLNS